MAVCGHCVICGHKFNGMETPDVGARLMVNPAAPFFFDVEAPRLCMDCLSNIGRLQDSGLQSALEVLAIRLGRRGSNLQG